MSKMANTEKKANFLRQFRTEANEFKQLTASQFSEIWNHYDSDGNGFIEGHELDKFLRELSASVNKSDVNSTELLPDSIFTEYKKSFLEAYDENEDGKISVQELAQLLPTEEGFLLLFRRENYVDSGNNFMKVWKEFDSDCSGFIESNELKTFIVKLLERSNKKLDITDEKLNEYTNAILSIYDQNGDGKLCLSEMIKLLPVTENSALKTVLSSCATVDEAVIEKIFNVYDSDGSGLIDGHEIDNLVRDIMNIIKKDGYGVEELNQYKNGLMAATDVNQDGNIDRKELKLILMSFTQ